jgi:hypothetical protein
MSARTSGTSARADDECSDDSDEAGLGYQSPLHSWPKLIQQVANDVWGLPRLHRYQLKIIQTLISGATPMKRRALLCVKTGGGKSAVVQVTATIMRGIHIILVPLLALGADQVSKGNSARSPFSQSIRAIHLDEVHHPQKVASLREFLSNMSMAQTLIIVASPQSLLKTLPWNSLLLDCAHTRNLVRGVYVDEYHLFASFGSSFRPEFEASGKQFITKLFNPRPIPAGYDFPSYLAMSASMNTRAIRDGEAQTKIFIPRDQFFWSTPSEFRRREILVSLDLIQPKQVSRTVFGSIYIVLKANPTAKVVLYTNSKIKSESLQEKLEEFLDHHGFSGDVILVNGELEASEKFFAIKLFLGNVGSEAIVPRVGVFTAGAANCGIDDPLIFSVHRLGFPCSTLDLIQELGRTARRPTASILTDSFRLFVNIHDFAYIMIRAFRNCRDLIKTANKQGGMAAPVVAKRMNLIDRARRNKFRDQQDIREVITFLCLDLGCFHARLEYAQCDPTLQYQFPFPPPCGDACYFCKKQHKHWFRAVSFEGCRQFFMTLLPLGKILLSKAIDLLWKNKDLLHEVFKIKSVNKYNVEGLFLQLLATGILNSDVGTDAFPDEAVSNDIDKESKIPDSLYVWVAFNKTTGNPCFNMDNVWHGISMIAAT